MARWTNYPTQMLSENVLLFEFANRRVYSVMKSCSEKGMSKAQAVQAVSSEVRDIFESGYYGAINDYPILDTVIPHMDELEIDYDQIAEDLLRGYEPSRSVQKTDNRRRSSSKDSDSKGKSAKRSGTKGKRPAKGRRRDAREVSEDPQGHREGHRRSGRHP